MAVVTIYGQGYKDPASALQIGAGFAEARLRIMCGTILVTNGNSIASKHYLGTLPTNAILIPILSNIRTQAITGLNSYSIGFERNGVLQGAAGSLATAIDLSGAASKDPLVTGVPALSLVKPAWLIAGLASDPGGMFDVVGLMNAAATATASFEYLIAYAKP